MLYEVITEFVDAVKGGVIPKEYIPAVDKGIQDALKSGVLAGYPTVDMKVELYYGSYHEVDSSEQAFYIAGSMAVKEAIRKAGAIIRITSYNVCYTKLLRPRAPEVAIM